MRVNRLFSSVVLITITLINPACSAREDQTFLKSIDETMIRASVNADNNSMTMLRELENKTFDSVTHRRADIWYPKASQIAEITEKLVHYIDDLKKKSKEVTIKNYADTLKYKLVKYRSDLFAVDPQLDSVFSYPAFFPDIIFGPSRHSDQNLGQTYFDHLTEETAPVVLSQLRFVVKNIESSMLTYCNHKAYHHDYEYWYRTFIGQSSTAVLPGETIEISAGVTAFARNLECEVIINGERLLSNEGFVNYKFKAEKTPGKHSIIIKIKSKDWPIGDEIEKKVEYRTIKVKP